MTGMGPRYVVRITPADVGRRVSVRFRISAEPGQPSASDAVGMLRSWDRGQLVIERRDGTMAVIEETALLAGRAVGPPPERPTDGG